MVIRSLFILTIVFVSCGPKTSLEQKELVKNFDSTQFESTSNNSEPIDSLKAAQIFKEFAEDYAPGHFAMLPPMNDSVLKAFQILKTSDQDLYEKYLTLIFVKLYRAHLENGHQSYELRKQQDTDLTRIVDPLILEFNNLAKIYQEGKRIEFISSNIAYAYVKSHPYLLKYDKIKEQMDVIEQIHKNIENGVYWK